MRAFARAAVRAAVLTAVLAAGCAAGPGPRREPATLDLPPWPSWPSAGLSFDTADLAAEAGAWCEAASEPHDIAAFFFGRLPAAAFGALCGDDPRPPEVLLGHVFLSGWYGGIWFRDNADFGFGPGGPAPGPVGEADYLAVADAAAALLAASRTGDAAAVATANLAALVGGEGIEGMMDSLATVFAYNWGYVEAILARSPAGVPPPAFPCAGWLDCGAAGTPVAAHDRFRAALPRLAAPPAGLEGDRWREVAGIVEQSRGWADVGRSLWEKGSVEPGAWRTLVDINAGYLRISALAALAAATGYAGRDEAAGRCALLLEAAADTWNRAYFLALRSNAPAGTLPGVTCP